MGRLKALRGRLGSAGSRVKALPKRAEGFYLSPEWREYRARHRAWTIAQQGGVWCSVCGSGERLLLDHRHERKDGGADFPPFDQADWYCTRCHNAKTAKAKGERATGGGGR